MNRGFSRRAKHATRLLADAAGKLADILETDHSNRRERLIARQRRRYTRGLKALSALLEEGTTDPDTTAADLSPHKLNYGGNENGDSGSRETPVDASACPDHDILGGMT